MFFPGPAGPLIGHVDGDSFYVNAERVRDRFLRDKPVGVVSNQGYFLIAKSNEMKRRGVITGEPLEDAVKKCPDGIYVKRDFQWYEVLSKQMHQALQELSPQVEYYSIDELFFTVPRGRAAQAFAEEVRRHLMQRVGLPATVGISRSRTLAKLIGDTAKPFGAVSICDAEGERELLARLPIEEISGISGRRALRLAAFGIKTCLDFAQADRRLIREVLTVVGQKLWYELNGESVEPIRTSRPRHQVISRGGSIGQASANPQRIWGFVIRNLERFIEALRFHRLRPGQVALYLQYRNDLSRYHGTTLLSPTDRYDVLLEAFRYCMRHCWIPGRLVVRMHLFATDLHGWGDTQRGLFDPPSARGDALARAKELVNSRLGRFALRSGQTLFLNDIYTDDANNYESCDVQGKMVF